MNATGWQQSISDLTICTARIAYHIDILATFIDCIQHRTFVQQIIVVTFTFFETIWMNFLQRSVWTTCTTEYFIELGIILNVIIAKWQQIITLLLLFLFVVVFVAIFIAQMKWRLLKTIAIQM